MIERWGYTKLRTRPFRNHLTRMRHGWLPVITEPPVSIRHCWLLVRMLKFETEKEGQFNPIEKIRVLVSDFRRYSRLYVGMVELASFTAKMLILQLFIHAWIARFPLFFFSFFYFSFYNLTFICLVLFSIFIFSHFFGPFFTLLIFFF